MQKTIVIILLTFFHTYLWGCTDDLVNEILGTHNKVRPKQRLKQRLKTAKENFNLVDNRRLNYKLATIAIHGLIQKSSKECPIYYGYKANDEINCEHIVPQSFFRHIAVMSSDLHYIYPAYKSINLIRGNCKFAEIPEEKAEFIYLRGSNQPSPKNTSCKNTCKISKHGIFEPNDESKGRVARACAYFFTRYPKFLAKMSQVIDIHTMISWHEKYPPERSEKKREKAVFYVQKNHNPYITQSISYMREIWLGNL